MLCHNNEITMDVERTVLISSAKDFEKTAVIFCGEVIKRTVVIILVNSLRQLWL